MLDRLEEAYRYAQRRLDDSLKPGDDIAFAWGRWRRRDKPPCDWAEENTLYRIWKQQIEGAAQCTNRTPPLLDVYTTVDGIYSSLVGVRQRMVEIVFVTYPNMPEEQQRRKLGMSQYKRRQIVNDFRKAILEKLPELQSILKTG